MSVSTDAFVSVGLIFFLIQLKKIDVSKGAKPVIAQFSFKNYHDPIQDHTGTVGLQWS